ncbi:MAG: arginine--tRNA ligase [Desulfuromonas sp.]|nr:MAG: arginine--tRNA ligase [Desulfuromonas sp.]
MKAEVRQRIHDALQACFREGTLTSGEVPEFTVEEPAQAGHGDLATNAAMLMARAERKAPRQIAEILVTALGDGEGLWSKIEIAGPGFINFFIAPTCWYAVLDRIMQEQLAFGRSRLGGGQRVQVEFVSANPTGPLHIGHGRGAAVGDAVAAVLEAAGFDVQREYYVNDAGNQVATLGNSILVRLRELKGAAVEFPEDGYQGEYIRDLAARLNDEDAQVLELPEEEALKRCAAFGIREVLEWIRQDLKAFGIEFDNWYSEQSLYERDMVNTELGKLADKGLSYEQDGALWFRTTAYGDDKDRVLIKSDGSPTYFASDVAYHMEKFERGFERVINVWGADHHGYVPRMKAVLAGLGHPPEDLEVLLIQMVNLLRDGQPFTMGKRSGNFIALREVIDEVGSDACRFFFLMRRADSQLDFDLELAKKQSNENPVYYVQYVHARVRSIQRNADEAGVATPKRGEVDFSCLVDDDELALAKLMNRYPEVVEQAARGYEPHRVIYYLQELAALFHSYYNRQKVLVEDQETARARLYLVECVRIVVANALTILGVSAPDRM